ncbi:hypothetical protein ACFQJ7_02380 [Halovenus rubra]|uniref:Uncharacterized protein n=2 Tax=Halovenus rubra TaxID=869890 RepID=A0ABD5X4F8_9EURY|nr:hypothetical protein [Halovenus rubra]
MSYKCSIFGHKYADSEVERERQEDGNEVIITVRETESCKRCEETRVVSENKEVTTLETAADIVGTDIEDDNESPEPTANSDVASPSSPSETGQESTVTDTGDTTQHTQGTGATVSEEIDPEEDDAVILEQESDDEDDEDREPGEWPEESTGDDNSDEDDTDWPEESTEDHNSDEDDTDWPEESTEDDNGDEEDIDWPEESTGSGDPDWELPTDIEPHPETEGPTRGSGSETLTIPEGEFFCSECEFTTSVESSSLRAGDFCPECHKGTLGHERD